MESGACITGADSIRDDCFVNKAGTAQIAGACRGQGKPFYVLAFEIFGWKVQRAK